MSKRTLLNASFCPLLDGGGHAIRILRRQVVEKSAANENGSKPAIFGLYERLRHCMKSAHKEIPRSQTFHFSSQRVLLIYGNYKLSTIRCIASEFEMTMRPLLSVCRSD